MKILFYFLFLFPVIAYSQTIIFGNIYAENGSEIRDAEITNLNNGQISHSNLQGGFMIAAGIGHTLRISASGFERSVYAVSAKDFTNSPKIYLKLTATEIAEVHISQKPSGILYRDQQKAAPPEKVQRLRSELANYISRPSTGTVLSPKAGEFVQPVVHGIVSFGKEPAKWDDVDFMEFLIIELGEDFFTKDLRLQKEQIQNFIYYIFKNFPRKNIIRFGVATPTDIARFVAESQKKLNNYRKGIPNLPPSRKKKK